MSENSLDLLGGTKQMLDNVRTWADVDSDEQEYLDRLASFGEGFHAFLSGKEESGEMAG